MLRKANLLASTTALWVAMAESTKTQRDVLARIRSGEQDAFVVLIRRYERSLVALIRSRLGAVDAVQDVLQETLVHAWTGLRTREPRDVRAWLYQVARNRCSDHLRSAERREHALPDAALAVMVDRRGVADARRRRVVDEVVETFEALPAKERQALRSFYVDGFSIREIAAREDSPPGTIKRRLSHGRDRVRGLLGIASERRRMDMSNNNLVAKAFPADRPSIGIERVEAKASDVDMRELIWWFAVPELHDEVHWAEYQPVDGGSAWRLTRVSAMRAQRQAVIHDLECVEIEVKEQGHTVAGVPVPPQDDRHTRVWGRLTDAEVQWIGVERLATDGTRKLYTFLDDHFEDDFGAGPRRIPAGDYLTEAAGGLSRREDTPERFADGVFAVRVGEATFRCTRVVELSLVPAEWDVVIVAYVDAAGRTVLFRRYDDDRREVPGESKPRREILPQAEQLMVDGNTYVHSFDYVTATACGVVG